MEPTYSAYHQEDVVLCDICFKSIADVKCTICHFHLCGKCSEDDHALRLHMLVKLKKKNFEHKHIEALFDSFQVCFLDDSVEDSFASEILGKESLAELVKEIQSLAYMIVSEKHHMFEVKVVNKEDHLNIVAEV